MKNKNVKKSYYKRVKLLKFLCGFFIGFLFASLLDPCNTAFEFGYLVCANVFGLFYFIEQILSYRRTKKNERKETKK